MSVQPLAPEFPLDSARWGPVGSFFAHFPMRVRAPCLTRLTHHTAKAICFSSGYQGRQAPELKVLCLQSCNVVIMNHLRKVMVNDEAIST